MESVRFLSALQRQNSYINLCLVGRTQEDRGTYPCQYIRTESPATLLLHGELTVARRESAAPVKRSLKKCIFARDWASRACDDGTCFSFCGYTVNFVTFLVGGWGGAEVSMVYGSSTQGAMEYVVAMPLTSAGSSMQHSKVQGKVVAVLLLLQPY